MSARDGRTRWLLYCFLFFLGWVVMYADRSILSPVQELVRVQFGLTNSQVGLISSLFFIVYVLTQIPSGILGDRVGRIRLITVGFVIFGIATSLTGVAGMTHLFGALLLMRAMAGFGEGFYYGPQFAKSAEVTPLRRRALGAAIINSGQGFGTALGIAASSFLSYRVGLPWYWTFIVFGVLTLGVGTLIAVLIPDGKGHRDGSLREEISGFLALLRRPVLLGAFAMLFAGVYAFFVMVTWLPTFLSTQWGMEPGRAGTIASLPFWIAVPAGILVGFLSDRLGHRRAFVAVLAPAAVLTILVLGWTGSEAVLIGAIVLYGAVGKLALDPVLISTVADHVDNASRSTAYGLYNCIGMGAAVLSPPLSGLLVDAGGSYRSAFALAASLLVLGAACFLLTYRRPAPTGAGTPIVEG
ncbi:MFS transporter [Brachybacterium hainanense]|uniref:MFS transporter n=1 Tax=Brachybacterium hainanense TaxID=1541174 RepID=A0ABV6RAU2_9MICO